VSAAGETLTRAIGGLDTLGLEEVLAVAELQARVDRKYLVPLPVFSSVMRAVADGMAALEIDDLQLFRYESVYFDTPGLLTYRQHAHGRRRRFKVRTRAYLDSRECLLELKRIGGRGETLKDRLPHSFDDRHDLDADARTVIATLLGPGGCADELEPVVTTAYRRATLVDTRSGSRVTCDVDLRFEGRRGLRRGPEGIVLVESKTVGAASSTVDRALRDHGLRPVSLSKYCVGMAMLDPALPANRWNRELRQHFVWTPRRFPA
jgi:hypothetical protein